ncbi:cadherin-like domain-containing protein, partial [Mesorhizobium kowhaii]
FRIFTASDSTFAEHDTITDFSRDDGDKLDLSVGRGSPGTYDGGPLVFRGEIALANLTTGTALGGSDVGAGFTQVWWTHIGATTILIADINSNFLLDADDLVVELNDPLNQGLSEGDFLAGNFIAQVGRNIDETMNGTPEDDLIYSVGGNDTVNGLAGSDTIYGGDGMDTLNGGLDGDYLYGEGNDDTLNGDEGGDRLVGGLGADTLHGGDDADILIGGVDGTGNGGDTALNTLFGDLGDDQLYGDAGDDELHGGGDNDTIVGNGGNDRIFGDQGADAIYGGGGNDLVIIERATNYALGETIDGGDGFDTIRFASTIANDTLTLRAGISSIEELVISDLNGSTSGTTALNIDASNLSYGLSLKGNAGANEIIGTAFDDVINGGLGNDVLDGGSRIDSGPEKDIVSYSDRADAIVVTLNGSADAIVTVGGVAEDTIRNFEGVTGGSGDDVLTGDGLANFLSGSGGNDTIDGSGGDDTVVFTGPWTNYTISVSNGVYTIIDKTGVDGSDSVANVENFAFSNGTFSGAEIINDAPVGVNDANASDSVIEAGGVANSTVGDATATGNALSNDTDADSSLGDTLSINGAHAGASALGVAFTPISGATSLVGTYGTLLIDVNGDYTYSLNDSDLDTQALAEGAAATDSFTYRLVDANGATATAQIDISIVGSNDAPTATLVGLSPIAEDSGTLLITQSDLLATAADVESDSLTASGLAISSGAGSLIDNGDGTWSYTPALNDDTDVSYSYTISDGHGGSIAGAAHLDITPVNDVPTTSAVILAPIEEGSGARLITQAELLANASDVDGDSLTASNLAITAGAGSLVDNGDGTWSYTPAANDESDVSYSYTVSDGSGGSVAGSATLDIIPVANSSPPTITSEGGGDTASLAIAENSTAVSTVTATDPDAGDTLTYSIAAGFDANLFSIDGQSGALSFVTAPDFENPNLNGGIFDQFYSVVVKADDGHGGLDTQTITVTVTNVNDNAPVFTSGTSASFAENGTGVAYDANAGDSDNLGALTYSLAGTDAALFDIDASTGEVTFKATPDFETPADSDGNNVYDIVVTASDGTLSTDRSVAIMVTDVPNTIIGDEFDNVLIGTSEDETILGLGGNDTISGGGGDDNLRGGSGSDILDGGEGDDVIHYGFSDSALGDTIDGGAGIDTISVEGNNSDLYRVSITGVERLAFDTTSSATVWLSSDDVGAGQINTFVGSAFFDQISVRVTSGGTADLSTAVFQNWGPNDSLELIGSNANDVLIGSVADDVIFGSLGADTMQGGAGNDKFSFNAGDVASGESIDGGSGTDQLLIFGNNDFRQATLGSIETLAFGGSAIPATVAFSSTQIGAGLSMDASVVGNAGANAISISMDAPGTLDIGAWTFSNWSSNDSIFMGGSSSADTLIGSSQADEIQGNFGNDILIGGDGDDQLAGQYDVDTLTGGAGVDTFAGSVTDWNGDRITDYEYGEKIMVAFGSASASDYRLRTTATDSFIDIDGNGDGTFDSTIVLSGQIHGTLTVIAAANPDYAQLVITPNTAPAITSNGGGDTAQVSVAENATAVTTVSATDPDAGDTLTYSIVGGADSGLFQIDATTGVLSFQNAPDFEAPADSGGNNVYDVKVEVSDGSSVDNQSIAVTVTDVAGQTITGTNAAQTLTGTPEADIISGLGGNDTLNGLADNDYLDGGAGVDTMVGGIGNDTYVVDNTGDIVDETGGDGTDLVRSSIAFSLSDAVHVIGSVENLTLTGTANVAGTGNALANVITGNTGNNTLAGLGGADTLIGDAGTDTASYAASAAGVDVSLTTGVAHGGDAEGDTFSGIEGLLGSAQSDTLEGDGNNNVLNGGAGIDTLSYEHAAAAITVSLATTAVQNTIGSGSDTLSGFENLIGSAFGDTLTGSAAANMISAMGGDDVLNGGAGADSMLGGAGSDTYVVDNTGDIV